MDQKIIKNIKFTVMLLLGLTVSVRPESLMFILLFVWGGYLTFSGFTLLVSTMTLIKFKREWIYEGIKSAVFLVFGLLFIFNTSAIAETLSSLLFLFLGLIIIFMGVMSIVRTRDNSTGIILIVIGLIISLFPLGVSNLIVRIMGISLTVVSVYILYLFNKTRSF